jgi:hypothetical protein
MQLRREVQQFLTEGSTVRGRRLLARRIAPLFFWRTHD